MVQFIQLLVLKLIYMIMFGCYNPNNKIHELLIYNVDGKFFKKYNVTKSTIHSEHESYLSNILVDLKDNYVLLLILEKYLKKNL